MNSNDLLCPKPRIAPALDADFRPAALGHRAFAKEAEISGGPEIRIALEQADGSVFRFDRRVLPRKHPASDANYFYVERLVKFLLWSRGGFRVYFDGPAEIGARLQSHFRETATGRFDADIMGEKIYGQAFEIVVATDMPPARAASQPLGRHLKGCRIGFDLGASDRKAAAVIDGRVIFSGETLWDPVHQSDPQWHFDQIMDSLKQAAAHLPRVDAIGGSSAGVYVNNRVRVASLFRGVPEALFDQRVRNLFVELKAAWGNIPFEVVNDGEVTALAGSMALGKNAVLGIAMGSSQAAGFVTPEGGITSWLNELAFTPVDYNATAPADEWSKDRGCGVQYFSQQCVGRLMPAAGIETPDGLPLPEKLKHVQALMEKQDPRAEKIYQTIGVYFGYAAAHYAEFYDFEHLLVLGRVTTGAGGEVIVRCAQEVLRNEFPDVARKIAFHIPDEKEKRHGQAIAAASLPAI
ncbi:MAG TPA: ROK family protein [Verrucomicrobiae bacterium]|nr:ROK family protein [Verrucomicrobiae bacterium]